MPKGNLIHLTDDLVTDVDFARKSVEEINMQAWARLARMLDNTSQE